MSQSHELIVSIAQRVAPDEAEFADRWLDDFLAGGHARKSLAPAPGVAGGAISQNVVLAIPGIIWALAAIAPQMSGLIKEGTLSDIGKSVKSALEWMTLRERLRDTGSPGEKAKVESESDRKEQTHVNELRINDERTTQKLVELTNVFCRELERRGNSPETARRFCYTTLSEVLANPSAGVELMEKIKDART